MRGIETFPCTSDACAWFISQSGSWKCLGTRVHERVAIPGRESTPIIFASSFLSLFLSTKRVLSNEYRKFITWNGTEAGSFMALLEHTVDCYGTKARLVSAFSLSSSMPPTYSTCVVPPYHRSHSKAARILKVPPQLHPQLHLL